MHFGSARDYLASLIALRLGKDTNRVDALAKLLGALGQQEHKSDAILAELVQHGIIEFSDGQWHQRGWLRLASDLRNRYVHRQPYGLGENEKSGWIRCLSADSGLHAYHRPMIQPDCTQADALDIISYIYRQATGAFHRAVVGSGYAHSVPKITDADIVQMEITEGGRSVS